MIRFLYSSPPLNCRLVLVVGLMILTLPVSAQLLASRSTSSPPPLVKQQEGTLVSTLIERLQQRYDASFLYEKSLLQNKRANAELLFDQSLEINLAKVLRPARLTYQKIDQRTYVIVAQPRPVNPVQRLHPGASLSANEPGGASALAAPVMLPTLAHAADAIITNWEKTISGKVTDGDSGEPLPGVNVLAKNTTQGTITDIDGNYQLSVPDDTEILVFSSVGYVSREVPIQSRSSINIGLTVSTQELGEVVVTALGIKKETKKLGYATAKVESEQITTNRTPNFMNTLQGKIAGVNISSSSTGPGSTSKIRIRGQSSFLRTELSALRHQRGANQQ